MEKSKTPEFDSLMDIILNNLKPGYRKCGLCLNEFKIEKEDIEFFKLFRVPPSKSCPDCRHRRRLSFSNYSSIYRRKCDFPGHNDTMISPVAPVMPWVTYDYDTYYSDTWDPFYFSQEVNFNKSFFDNFLDLLKIIPQPGVRRGADSPNSEFSFYGKHMKDCYYVFGGRRSEDIIFSSSIYDSRHIVDSYFTRRVEGGYDNVSTADCNNCKYTYFSSGCIDCDFLYDCRNCSNCFGCINLRNKSYCMFNEQLSKDEYLKQRSLINIGSRKIFLEYQKKFWNFIKTNPIRAVRIFNSVDVSGNDIKKSKNCFNCFQIEDSENVRHSHFAIMNVKDSMDIGFSGKDERVYDSQNTSTSSNVKFSFAVKESSDSEFLMSCTNCHNCFGCVGLKNASYVIFNKKYEPNEYYSLIDKIKTKMLKDDVYGEFFPMVFSPCAYNSSMANIIYPMTENEAEQLNLYWQPDIDVDTKNLKNIPTEELPDDINEATSELCDLAVLSKETRKPFKIIQREIDFYKKNLIPLPVYTPYERMLHRFKILNNFKIYKENCFSCNKNIESAYKRDSGYKPFCDDCYKRDIL